MRAERDGRRLSAGVRALFLPDMHLPLVRVRAPHVIACKWKGCFIIAYLLITRRHCLCPLDRTTVFRPPVPNRIVNDTIAQLLSSQPADVVADYRKVRLYWSYSRLNCALVATISIICSLSWLRIVACRGRTPISDRIACR